MNADISTVIAKANARLKPLKISIIKRGKKLSLQASLSPKIIAADPLSDIARASINRQQTELSLGLRADLEGVRLAEAKVREISGLLLQNAFDWEPDYQIPEPPLAPKPLISDWISSFEIDYFNKRSRNPKGIALRFMLIVR